MVTRVPFFSFQFFGVLPVLIYRCIFAIYCFCWIIVSGVHPANGDEKWFIYLTNWLYLFLTLYFVCSAILTAFYYRGEWMVGEYDVQDHDVLRPKARSRTGELQETPQDEENFYVSPLDMRNDEPVYWYHGALWVIYSIAAANAIAVTLLYWIYGYRKYPDSYRPDGLDISTHLLNSVFILIDTSLSRIPVRIYHVIYPIILFVVYVMFGVVYWASDGTNVRGKMYIYSSMDFSNRPGVATAFIFGYTFIGLVTAQLGLFGLSKLRSWVSGKISQRKRRHCSLNEET